MAHITPKSKQIATTSIVIDECTYLFGNMLIAFAKTLIDLNNVYKTEPIC